MSELDPYFARVYETIDRYCRAWSDPDPAIREELIALRSLIGLLVSTLVPGAEMIPLLVAAHGGGQGNAHAR